MPITEIVRELAEAPGLRDGRAVRVALIHDVDGRMGPDERAVGSPKFWLRAGAGAALLGPYETEDEAIEEAEARFGARF